MGVANDVDMPTPHIQGDDIQLMANEITSANDDLSVVSNFV